ncbi:hypothetical protein QT970_25560 [Microcoleus sp. herbarium8]|uniref:hypothetical protein n=1 Tax=Microcoleus sp. herbarium8 TaxID=3055436 RepID=UPI002FD53DA0
MNDIIALVLRPRLSKFSEYCVCRLSRSWKDSRAIIFSKTAWRSLDRKPKLKERILSMSAACWDGSSSNAAVRQLQLAGENGKFE